MYNIYFYLSSFTSPLNNAHREQKESISMLPYDRVIFGKKFSEFIIPA